MRVGVLYLASGYWNSPRDSGYRLSVEIWKRNVPKCRYLCRVAETQDGRSCLGSADVPWRSGRVVCFVCRGQKGSCINRTPQIGIKLE